MAQERGQGSPRAPLSTGRALALGVLTLVALGAFSALPRKAPEPAPSRPLAVPSAHGAPAPDQAAIKARRAAEIWAAYDRRPDDEKSKASLTDTLDAAAQIIKAQPRTPDDRALLEQQGVQFRRRAAPTVRPEARAEGAKADVLVPSPDREQCLEWGSLWSQDGANMAMLGFTRIECAGNPPRVWELRR